MAASRLCVFLAVLVSAKMLAAQPIFGTMWCDLMCDDDDGDDYSDGDIFDYLFDPCAGCTTTNKPAKTKPTTTPPGMQQPFNLVIPPANGMNVTMTPTGNSWLMNFIPWLMPAAPTRAPGPTTAAPATTAAATTPAGNTTAAATTKKA
ncbi:uncharacterized protein LOC134658630 [Cydia amplana]|uniref:uncharacterized protein LOC134658630 n=1 Tax=Cydia amplana TaxID=1869771 RepID=UPI002FE51B34